jgi:hypothetical protein
VSNHVLLMVHVLLMMVLLCVLLCVLLRVLLLLSKCKLRCRLSTADGRILPKKKRRATENSSQPTICHSLFEV